MSKSEVKNHDFKRRIHYEANKYLDVLTIMQQLERNGFIDKFHDLLSEVYDAEHAFTISELRKLALKAKHNQEVFDFVDHYSSNTSIFKQNLGSILEMFIETVWNAKFQKVYRGIQESTPEEIETMLIANQSFASPVEKLNQDSQELTKSLKPDLTSYFSQRDSGFKGKQSLGASLKKSGVSKRGSSEEKIKSPSKVEPAWEKPAPKFGSEPRDLPVGSANPGPATYYPQTDNTGTATFGKKKGPPTFGSESANPGALAKQLLASSFKPQKAQRA